MRVRSEVKERGVPYLGGACRHKEEEEEDEEEEGEGKAEEGDQDFGGDDEDAKNLCWLRELDRSLSSGCCH